MRDADAFEGTAFLGTARSSRRDAYRLGLFGQHLYADEEPRVLLPIRGATLLVTDRRILELRAHLDDHGAWNVQEFQGYVVDREIDPKAIREVTHRVRTVPGASAGHRIEDHLLLTTDEGSHEVLVSRGPQPTLSEDDFRLVREAIHPVQAK